jgi:hypothetical protein
MLEEKMKKRDSILTSEKCLICELLLMDVNGTACIETEVLIDIDV